MIKKPKLATVAKAAGVSTATVSQVMHDTGRISPSTRKRVLASAKKLHYVGDGRAASMRSGQNREIGFAIHQIANPFNAEVISGVSDLLETQGYLVSILDSRDDPERQHRILHAFIQSARGGLLWVPAQDTDDATYELLGAHAVPTVTFLRRSGKGRFDHVGIENTSATEIATRHLVELGHKHIAYLGGDADSNVRTERIAGYQSVISEFNLARPIIWDSHDDKVSGLNSMNALHNKHPEVTGIVCNGDMVAIGACLAISRLGMTPGKEISVIGFDDIEDAAIANPPLTTMAISPYQLGKKLARVAIERLQNQEAPTSVSLIPADLVIRETSGPPLK